jgi:outer membrane protein OmpA-like peptidoglycan-associated protein/opacity protein-like surface antigen
MSTNRIALALAGFVLLTPFLARADDTDISSARSGWYSSLGAGLNLLRDSSITGSGFGTKGKFDDGFAVDGAIGYQLGHLRGEGEIGYRRNDLGKLSTVGSGSGDASSFDFMVNGYYDFIPGGRIDPYIGAGVGVARVDFHDIGAAAGPTLLNDSDTKFAYQGIVGVRYLVAPQWDLGVEYRYFATLDPRLTTTAATVPASAHVDAPYHNDSVMLGMTYHFGQPAAPPPPPPPPAPVVAAAPPAPPPAPPVQAAPSVYLVFFEFDKSDISAVSAQVLDRAIADFQKSGSVKFLVQGYTDLAGSVDYNEKLSERRADSVKKYLLGHGVTVDQITTEWFGKSNPRVPTADGVRNQENRRAEIYLKK